jgi:hypothetical protein
MKFGLRYASLGRYSNGRAAVELAQAAEDAGFDSIWTVEHVVVPHAYQSRYPYSPSGRMGSGLEDFPIPDFTGEDARRRAAIRQGDDRAVPLTSRRDAPQGRVRVRRTPFRRSRCTRARRWCERAHRRARPRQD